MLHAYVKSEFRAEMAANPGPALASNRARAKPVALITIFLLRLGIFPARLWTQKEANGWLIK